MLVSMHGQSAIVGPNVGAVILQLTGSWQWMFLINIPIAMFLLLFGLLKIKESPTTEKGSLDLTGTMLLMLSILSFMLGTRSEEHTSELQSRGHLVCRLLLEKKNMKRKC